MRIPIVSDIWDAITGSGGGEPVPQPRPGPEIPVYQRPSIPGGMGVPTMPTIGGPDRFHATEDFTIIGRDDFTRVVDDVLRRNRILGRDDIISRDDLIRRAGEISDRYRYGQIDEAERNRLLAQLLNDLSIINRDDIIGRDDFILLADAIMNHCGIISRDDIIGRDDIINRDDFFPDSLVYTVQEIINRDDILGRDDLLNREQGLLAATPSAVQPALPATPLPAFKAQRRSTVPPSQPPRSIGWLPTVVIGVVVGIAVGAGSIIWWPVQRQADSPDTTSPVVPIACNYDGVCQYLSGESSGSCADCRKTPTATRRVPTATSRPTTPPTATRKPSPTSTMTSTPVPPPVSTPTLEPTSTNTPPPPPEPQCNPGEWSECGGRPPDVVCGDQYVSSCQADGMWGPCLWDPGRCAPSGPVPPSEEDCVCGNGICEPDNPCYESEYNCSVDCGAPPCDRWLDAVDCEAAGGRWLCGIAECYCHCPS